MGEIAFQDNALWRIRSLPSVNPGTVGGRVEDEYWRGEKGSAAGTSMGGDERCSGTEGEDQSRARTVTRRFVGGGPEPGNVRGVSCRVRFPDFSEEVSWPRMLEPETGRYAGEVGDTAVVVGIN